MQRWIRQGLSAYETLAQSTAGKFSVGDTVTMADLFLIPQLYNAARFDVTAAEFPLLARIWDEAKLTPAYRASEPEVFKPAQ
jgi:glutathione S-transferase